MYHYSNSSILKHNYMWFEFSWVTNSCTHKASAPCWICSSSATTWWSVVADSLSYAAPAAITLSSPAAGVCDIEMCHCKAGGIHCSAAGCWCSQPSCSAVTAGTTRGPAGSRHWSACTRRVLVVVQVHIEHEW